MREKSKDAARAADDASPTQAGSVYYRQAPEPKPRYTIRDNSSTSAPKTGRPKRSPNLGHAILLSNIRTFTIVALFMFGLLSLAVYITGRAWQNHQSRVRAEGRARQQTPPPTDTARPETPEAGVLMGAPATEIPTPHVRTELDTEAMRRAVFMQKRAEAQLAAGNLQEAIARFRDALDIWPHLTQVWAQLGRAYLETREFSRAQIALERAAENDPGNASILNDLGVALLYQNRIDQAMELFETVTDIDPNYASAHFNRALCYLARNDDEHAEQALNAYLRLRPNDARALKEKAYLQASRREYEEAMSNLQRALSDAPDWAPLYIDLAATAALMGRIDESIRYLDRAEALTSPGAVYRIYQQPAFREVRLTEPGRLFEQSLAERARELLAAHEPEEEPTEATSPMHSVRPGNDLF